ncbi:hypothetical protein PPERSA_11712 [Pseudocohnilembus persalinus]|uniref:Uncharacterized protein n=1 Tax=Pseudocohnilembus persalinus TaxID=266149 RepID=A0A0V0QG95_PSEPJ|nr:hypothetical protein PPERSA_11712 [Pseudocohnilembus persalinus]|eukprot:KRX01265.1 hypothetical protein PPERSA_11712 [Pseudocohnilembus persalinus]
MRDGIYKEYQYWKSLKKFMIKNDFYKMISEIEVETIQTHHYRKLEDIVLDERFSLEIAKQLSQSFYKLAQWTIVLQKDGYDFWKDKVKETMQEHDISFLQDQHKQSVQDQQQQFSYYQQSFDKSLQIDGQEQEFFLKQQIYQNLKEEDKIQQQQNQQQHQCGQYDQYNSYEDVQQQNQKYNYNKMDQQQLLEKITIDQGQSEQNNQIGNNYNDEDVL